MSVKLLTEHHLEFLCLKVGCTCSSESALVKCQSVGNHMSQLKWRYAGGLIVARFVCLLGMR